MSVQPRLRLSQRQKLSLTPTMRGALGLLRMPTEAVIEEMAREAAVNPFLELTHPGGGSAFDVALATVAGQEGLSTSLARQIDLLRLTPAVRQAALILVTELREDGYLDLPLDELAEAHDLSPDVAARGLAALQSCEPTGVGARSLAECLGLQLADRGYPPERAALIVRHLEAFAGTPGPRLQRALGCDAAELARIARDLRSLSPAPVIPPADPHLLRPPELLVLRGPGGGLEVVPNDGVQMQVRALDPGQAASESPELQALALRARDLARALTQRARTLLRIGRHIVATQPGFFLGNPPTILPESRKEAAVRLEIHPSTLSRALAGKSLAFEGKSIALSAFFQRTLPTHDGGISAFDLMARVRALIAAEDRALPLSDEVITAHLRNEGVDIARRTVAKYRKCMRIPPSHQRRRRIGSEPRGTPGQRP